MLASNRAAERGFTLMEVLAALVIISLGMLAVIEAVGQVASSNSRMRDRTLAHWVGMNRLTAVRLEQRAPKIDETSDEVEMAGRRWRWTMEVTETPVKSMLRIDIRVAPAEAGEDASFASVTGFYGSAIATAAAGQSIWQVVPQQEVPPGADQPGEGDRGNEPQDPEPNQPDPGGEPVDPPTTDPPPEQEQ